VTTRDLVFEIGTEELPSGPLYGAIEQLQTATEDALREARVGYGAVKVTGTPRRIVIAVSELAELQEDRTLRVKGPAAKAAFDAEGNPTQAAIGFARGKGIDVASLTTVEEGGNSYVYAVIEETGGPTAQVLPGILGGLVAGIEWPKSQRWGAGEARFSRPVRWLLALFGADVVPVEFAGLTAGRMTEGHRFLARGPHEVPAAYAYPLAMERAKVLFDLEVRAKLVREGIEAAASAVAEEIGAAVNAVVPEKTFAEVVNLVEYPTVAVGMFDADFLSVPREVLENAMESHQRYFPLEDGEGTLLNRFVVVHNGDPERTDAIVRGHERVIRARLADAAFFYREDVAQPLEAFAEKLGTITFQAKLGTLLAKVERVERLAEKIAAMLGAGADETSFAVRAAHLAKADLLTSVVVEFPTLQGVMGRYYALSSGEEAQVAEAIVEHYRPRFAGDDVPASLPGRIVALADKLDTIAGIFAAGMQPTGSADPYALRRSAIGVLQIALASGALSLVEAISAALDGYQGVTEFSAEETGRAVRDFFTGRFEVLLRDRGIAYDTVDAVLAVAADDPADALARAEALTAARSDAPEAFEDLSVAFTRAKNLSKPELGDAIDFALLGDHERKLAGAIEIAEGKVEQLMRDGAYQMVLGEFAALRVPVDEFFENVLVMDEDAALRENRLRLLNRFVALFSAFADFSKLAG
jgi:glycyl-tRNA synthetase beta chain